MVKYWVVWSGPQLNVNTETIAFSPSINGIRSRTMSALSSFPPRCEIPLLLIRQSIDHDAHGRQF